MDCRPTQSRIVGDHYFGGERLLADFAIGDNVVRTVQIEFVDLSATLGAVVR
jgi:hypothetical protein